MNINQDELILQQQRQIEKEVSVCHVMLSQKLIHVDMC